MAFTGSRGSKKEFSAKLDAEAQRTTPVVLHDFDLLREHASTVYSDAVSKYDIINPVSFDRLVAMEARSVLQKIVVGKDDIDISAMIKKLGNSDWVKSGRKYYDDNDGYCPFCQQSTDDAFSKSISEYFDEAYTADMNEIQLLQSDYGTLAADAVAKLDGMLAGNPTLLDCEALKVSRDLLKSMLDTNVGRLAQKKEQASNPITLESIGDVAAKVSELVALANTTISAHNKTVDNLASERKKLTEEVWRFIVEEAKVFYDGYSLQRRNAQAAIDGLRKGISEISLSS